MSEAAARGRSYAIASPHHAATEAGVQALREGGNALDAAVAAAAALAVVYPHNCAIGGDLIALVRRPDGSVVSVNGSGASAAATSTAALRAEHARMPIAGSATVTVPGMVGGWGAVLSLGGRRPLADALEAAIVFAEEGVPVARSLAGQIQARHRELAADEGCRALFFNHGAPLSEGSSLRQPALARSLQAIALEGPPALYGGEVGSHLIAGLRSLGSRLTTEDLTAHETDVAPPIGARWRDLDVLTAPPNSQGFVLLEILSALEAFGQAFEPQAADAGLLARLFALVSFERERYLGDPRFVDVPCRELLSAHHAHALARKASSGRSLATEPGSNRMAGGDTVAVVAADGEGFAVSLIQSLFWSFGACILEPTTGILCHNRGAGFSLDARSPNVLEPSKRPAHTLMPVLLSDGNRLVGVNGTMGGYAQPQIHAHLLLAAAAGATAAEAVRLPRWTVATADKGEGVVVAESDVSEAAIKSIEAAGFNLQRVGQLDETVGHAQSIAVVGGGYVAGSDPRADGLAATGPKGDQPGHVPAT
jgi:gamma-glutamyltranspeptidase/glutathione hydrolase